jgi:peptidoglycan/LPS O-acetylase OafA/YrhL
VRGTPQISKQVRVPGIDLLRGLCIVAVVLHHINLRIRFNHSLLGQAIGTGANNVLFWSGYYGVRVFFVVSGFLIAGWSLKRWGDLGNIDRRQFYVMRFARIVPCLVGLLALLSAAHLAGVPNFTINPQRASLSRALLAACTFHVNWLEARKGYLPAGWDVLWSLSVEEVFYLVFPLVCVLARKRVVIVGVLLAFVAAGPFARVLTTNQLWGDYSYLSCMDGIALGCIAAIVCSAVKLSRRTVLALQISGLGLCTLMEVFRGTAARLGFYKVGLDVTLLEAGTALLLIAIQQRFENGLSVPRRRSAVLRCFGRNSYEVYLTHMLLVWPFVMLFFHFHININAAAVYFLVITALAGLAGEGVSRFYSEPLNRALRLKFLSPKSVAVAVQAASK